MTEPLNVIALISGGKDSFFSILHCIQNGHKVIALGNLYPPAPSPNPRINDDMSQGRGGAEAEHDLNSFMYQTVGHNVIPLYERALGIPLYRQQIIGGAVQTGKSYSHSDVLPPKNSTANMGPETNSPREKEDETESLVPLLRKIISEHPNANALCTGAILSTYQRTRIESVALRLGLTPLAYLWKYPILPPSTQTSLLEDMQAVGLDARIVKVASGGLDESFLWGNVASEPVFRRMERSMKRFGTDGDGAVLGEGGEFETLVVDGPTNLFKGRIEVQETHMRINREGGGSAWLGIRNAKTVMKSPHDAEPKVVRIPQLLEQRFRDILDTLNGDDILLPHSSPTNQSTGIESKSATNLWVLKLSRSRAPEDKILHWTISADKMDLENSISDEAEKVIEKVRQRLTSSSLDAADIISTIIILRSMQDFATVNKVTSVTVIFYQVLL
jgi:diphthine-ammonia ligase